MSKNDFIILNKFKMPKPINNSKDVSNYINNLETGSRLNVIKLSKEFKIHHSRLYVLIKMLAKQQLVERRRSRMASAFYKKSNLSERDVLEASKLRE